MKTVSARLLRVVDFAAPLLAQVTEADSLAPALPSGWSRKDLLAHLIDSASNNHQRVVRAAQQDSLDFPGYDQAGNVALQRPGGVPWPTLLALWANYNRYLSHVIAHLPEGKSDTLCRIGVHEPVTLRYLVEDYLRHLEHHLAQVGAKLD